MITFGDLARIIDGSILIQENDPEIRYLGIDSRRIISSPHTLFFAIKGERNNGHHYIHDLAKMGVGNFVVEEESFEALEGVNIIKVSSSVRALQMLAADHRSKFNVPIIGITGSSGKTIVKEWLFQLLQPDKVVCRSPKSYNSQVGVPLSVWQLNEHHDIAIIEAGISQPEEMAKLQKIIKPNIGIFTNIGTAHDSGFKSREEKTNEKAILFSESEKVIFCADDPYIQQECTNWPADRILSWSSKGASANLQVKELNDRTLRCTFQNDSFDVTIPGVDQANRDNSVHCIAAMLLLGYSGTTIRHRFKDLTPVSMRLELKKGVNNCSIIDDSYNNDLAGLEIALDFLTHQSKKGKKTLILSDILTSGLSDEELYKQIDQVLDKKHISRLIGVGERISSHQDKFTLPRKFYDSTRELLKEIDKLGFHQEAVLIKGARNFRLEKVAESLALKMHNTILEINLDSLTQNLNYFKSKLNPGVEVMAMVKAFAYGSGSVEIARWLQFHKVNYLAVAYADEGVLLRNNDVEIPIMVMNPTPETFDKIITYDLQPEIYSKSILRNLVEFLADKEEVVSVHVKIDTGMHRLGFDEEELDHVKDLLQNEKIKIESVFTHLASQDDEKEDAFTRDQVQEFESAYEKIAEWTNSRPVRHVLNSAGVLRFPEYQFERVRLGIGIYGIDPVDAGHSLVPVGTFRTIISQVKKLKKGDSVGYSRSWKAEKDVTIATIPVGYADGFDRRFGNGVGRVIINGKAAPVIGNVCMDMTMIELGGIDAKEGDEVIIYGPENTIQDMAKRIGTIPYELLTGIGDRVKRVFVSE